LLHRYFFSFYFQPFLSIKDSEFFNAPNFPRANAANLGWLANVSEKERAIASVSSSEPLTARTPPSWVGWPNVSEKE
jgi:hypothetical protein